MYGRGTGNQVHVLGGDNLSLCGWKVVSVMDYQSYLDLINNKGYQACVQCSMAKANQR